MIEIFSVIPGTTSLRNMRDDKLNGVHLGLKNINDFYNFQNFRMPKILTTKDYVRLYPIVMWIRVCMIKPSDHQILALQSSGLVEHWQKSYTKTIKDIEDTEPKKLEIDQFIGIITICAALYALSVFIFLLELLTLKCKAIKTFIDFLTFK